MTVGRAEWSTSTEVDGGQVRLTLMLSTGESGCIREFHPYLDAPLDEAHALILFGELGLALQELAARKPAND